MPADESTRTRRAGAFLLAATVPLAALAIGSLLPVPLIVVTLAATAASVLVWMNPPRLSQRAGRSVILCSLLLLGFTAFQAVPLPRGVVALLASTNADVWDRALTPFGEAGPAFHSLSVAPQSTHVEILRGVLYTSVFLTALGVASEHGGTRRLEIIVVGSACLLAIVTLVHAALHAERVLGFYAPHDAQGYAAGRLGPLLNPNHFAAYMNLGACVAAGAALRERSVLERIVAGAAVVLLAGASVWAGSRGGTGALVFGGFIIGVIAVLKRRSRKGGLRSGAMEAIVVLFSLAAAGVLIGLGMSDVAQSDLVQRDMSKLDLVKETFRLVPLSPLFGTGRGAFETMFPLVHEGPAYSTFLRAEDIVAQWSIEWGVPITALAFGLLLHAARPRSLFRADVPAFGAWTALAVTFVHELVDFHLEVPAVAMVAAVCMAMVVASNRERSTRGREKRLRLTHRRYAFALVPLAFVAVVVVLVEKDHSLADDRDAIAKLAANMTTPDDTFRSELRAAVLRHPAEPFFPLAAAVHYQGTRRENVIPWVARALERYPRFGRAHLVLARALAVRGLRAQARLEYRLAFGYDNQLRVAVLREAPYLVDNETSGLELVPDGPDGITVLAALAEWLGERLPSTAAKLDDELARRDPADESLLRRRIKATMSDLSNQHPWCSDRMGCAAPAFTAAEALIGRMPEKCEPYILQAQLYMATGRADVGLDRLARSIERTMEPAKCLRALVGLSLEAGDKRRADAAFESATRFSCGSRAECIDLYVWAAATEAGRGNLVRAVAFDKRAADLAPEDDTHLLRVAQLAERANLLGEALDAYRKLLQRHPDDADLRRRESELRARASKPGPTVPL